LHLPDEVVKLDISDIYYVEVMNRQLHYYTCKGEYVIKGVLKNAEEKLRPYHFEKCNHWYLVNLRHVEKISHNSVTVGGSELEMSRRMRPILLEALNEYMGGN
jgi:DNA-binding LytR/AlgR family response regulator